jgi:putative ABC transport system permease protein
VIRQARRAGEAIVQAVATIRGNPLRALLAALAMATAVGTMALVVSGLAGLVEYAKRTGARAFGADTFVVVKVASGGLNRRELADRLARNPDIRASDVRFLERHAGGRVLYAPVVQRAGNVSSGGRTFENAAISGTTATLYDIRDLGLSRGRFISRDEQDRAALVAVIGADVADAIFPGVDPLGRRLRIGGRGFDVIGLQARQGTAGGASLDRYAWIPLAAHERIFGPPESLQVFSRSPKPDATLEAEDRAHATMRARRHQRPGQPDAFDIITPEAARGFVGELASRVSGAAVPISIMALLAAVVVVTNTTLVSVAQRTREIGVRRAVGASPHEIVLETLSESTLVGLGGGLVGLAGAWALTAVITRVSGVEIALDAGTAAASLGAAVLSGLAAGWYPARRAASIDVIAALRQD